MSRRLTTDEIIQKFKTIHGEKFDYSKTLYINGSTKVEIICNQHGSFFQLPFDHIKGCGCSSCSRTLTGIKKRSNTKDFIKNATKIHGNKFDYSESNYITSSQKVKIICKTHGTFSQTPAEHLSGRGCKLCKYENHSKQMMDDTNSFIEKAELIHGNRYDYSEVVYNGSLEKVDIICLNHGIFQQLPSLHINNSVGCPKCKYEVLSKLSRKTTDQFIIDANKIHDNKYDYSLTEYKTAKDHLDIICNLHGLFSQRACDHLHNSRGCPVCSASQSKPEKFLEDFFIAHNVKYIKNDRTIIKPKELDFYLPDYKIAIEFDGTYFHSEISGGKDKNYHLNKTKECEKLGIRLIHIFESEYIHKQKIITSKLKHILGLSKYKIFARKCQIKPIDKQTKKQFLTKYHIQGDGASCIELGLFYKNRLVQIITLSKRRIAMGGKVTPDTYELSRMCSINNFTIIGGASKLLKYFEKIYTPKELISYADKRWSSNIDNVYQKVGFNKTHESSPNYWYFLISNNHKMWHRYMFAKHLLSEKLKIFNSEITEWDNMRNNGYDRIWDCGNLVYSKSYC
jgi:very-short-patch-repair endonuclease